MHENLDSSILSVSDSGNDNCHVIIMVGLPGRGKSYMSHRICRWLNWRGFECQIFNAGDSRRKLLHNQFVDYHWFNANSNSESYKLKENIAEETLKEMISWLSNTPRDSHKVGIFDATNSTIERRNKIISLLSQTIKLNKILFVESICNDEDIIHQNFICDKSVNDDYKNMNLNEAEDDFKKRIIEYNKIYQPINEDKEKNSCFIQIYNLGQKFIVNNLSCNLQKKIAYFLFNLNKKNVTIYMTRHGQSQGQIKHIIGGNSDLTESGKEYSAKLKHFFDNKDNNKDNNKDDYDVICSKLTRAKNTAKIFKDDPNYTIEKYSALNEINGGEFEDMTFDEVKEKYPDIHKLRNNNKFRNAWPGGESYYDLTIRLEPVLMRIENASKKLIIIAHQAICRIIYAYLMNIPAEDCVNLEINSHRLFEFNNVHNKREVNYYDL
jgi:6-phosphofructo-2-kinase/fructose-2,6-biphosphatase 2